MSASYLGGCDRFSVPGRSHFYLSVVEISPCEYLQSRHFLHVKVLKAHSGISADICDISHFRVFIVSVSRHPCKPFGDVQRLIFLEQMARNIGRILALVTERSVIQAAGRDLGLYYLLSVKP